MIFLSFFFLRARISKGDKGCAYKAARMSQRGGLSAVTSVSEHARVLSPRRGREGGGGRLNPRNIHTGAPTRYYRGIIQTYLYPSPMTADMTCDRLRYRLHDMFRSPFPLLFFSLSLLPTLPSQFSTALSVRPCTPLFLSCFSRCHRRWKICSLHDVQLARIYMFLIIGTLASNKTNNVELIKSTRSLTLLVCGVFL